MDSIHYIDSSLTLGQFIDIAKQYGLKLKEKPNKLISPSGKSYPVKYLERVIDDGPTIMSALPELDFYAPLDFYTLRQLCSIFGLPMKSFCFTCAM